MKIELSPTACKVTAELHRLRSIILGYDRKWHKAFNAQMGLAFLTGLALIRAKNILPHGDFGRWIKAELPKLSKGSAGRYVEFATAILEARPEISKFPTVGNLTERTPAKIQVKLPKPEEKELLKAVYELADGRTLTEMYRDLGVIRPAKTQAEVAAAREPHRPTPEEEAQAEVQRATAFVRDLTGMLAMFARAEEGIYQHCEATVLAEFEACRIEAGHAVKPFLQAIRAEARILRKNQTDIELP